MAVNDEVPSRMSGWFTAESIPKPLANHRSLQLRILRLGLLQDGDVGVGVFPEGEEVLVLGAGFGGVALQRRPWS